MNDSIIDEDFGQRVDLTVRIKEILSSYSDGITIIKEIIQVKKQQPADNTTLSYYNSSHYHTYCNYFNVAQHFIIYCLIISDCIFLFFIFCIFPCF